MTLIQGSELCHDCAEARSFGRTPPQPESQASKHPSSHGRLQSTLGLLASGPSRSRRRDAAPWSPCLHRSPGGLCARACVCFPASSLDSKYRLHQGDLDTPLLRRNCTAVAPQLHCCCSAVAPRLHRYCTTPPFGVARSRGCARATHVSRDVTLQCWPQDVHMPVKRQSRNTLSRDILSRDTSSRDTPSRAGRCSCGPSTASSPPTRWYVTCHAAVTSPSASVQRIAPDNAGVGRDATRRDGGCGTS